MNNKIQLDRVVHACSTCKSTVSTFRRLLVDFPLHERVFHMCSRAYGGGAKLMQDGDRVSLRKVCSSCTFGLAARLVDGGWVVGRVVGGW